MLLLSYLVDFSLTFSLVLNRALTFFLQSGRIPRKAIVSVVLFLCILRALVESPRRDRIFDSNKFKNDEVREGGTIAAHGRTNHRNEMKFESRVICNYYFKNLFIHIRLDGLYTSAFVWTVFMFGI